MVRLRCEIDQVGTSLLVHLEGELTLETTPQVRATLLKCLVEQPDVLVVDLSGALVPDPLALSVFNVVAAQAAMWPGTPVVLSVPQADLAALFAAGGYGRIAVFSSPEQALAAEPREGLPFLVETLLPLLGSPARARELAGEACATWRLPHLAAPARLVVGELVTNAVVHAQTIVDVRITLGRRYLLIAVRDGSPVEPHVDFGVRTEIATGRGLLLVDAVAVRWGSRLTDGGKVVWAALSRHETGTATG
ncbi:ATP-binding protein [Actinoplanes sp. M2I2]|uniref:ATP-binding protein n=1 Tax=Actinoplanes sp. M2I2 TaxID=1734444 RepID=UPI002021ED7D|nr:STAS domain-containing protein [Actinoplanes sp. M2I2]